MRLDSPPNVDGETTKIGTKTVANKVRESFNSVEQIRANQGLGRTKLELTNASTMSERSKGSCYRHT